LGVALEKWSFQQKLHLHLTLVPHGHNKFLLLNLLSWAVSGTKVRIMKMWFLVGRFFPVSLSSFFFLSFCCYISFRGQQKDKKEEEEERPG